MCYNLAQISKQGVYYDFWSRSYSSWFMFCSYSNDVISCSRSSKKSEWKRAI